MKGLTDKQVEEEIERLNKSPMVSLARKEMRIKYKRRQYLYQLRLLEKKGKALAEAGITMEMLLNEEKTIDGEAEECYERLKGGEEEWQD